MTNVDLTELEERPKGGRLYAVRMDAGGGPIEVPVAIQDQGSSALNRTAALRSALVLVEEFAASVRLCLASAKP